MQNILITAKSTIASVGHNADHIWSNYSSSESALTLCSFNDQDTPVGKLKPDSEKLITELRGENISYRKLDKSVLLAIKYCDYLIVNNKSKNILKQKLHDIVLDV